MLREIPRLLNLSSSIKDGFEYLKESAENLQIILQNTVGVGLGGHEQGMSKI